MGWSKFSFAALLVFAGILATTDPAAKGLPKPAQQTSGAKPAPPAARQLAPAQSAPNPPVPTPVRPAPAPSTSPTPPARFLIVLDAAHGGDDLGGHLSSGQLEKSVTLALSVRL